MIACEYIHMPLEEAYLCEDCHSVGNCPESCAACASQSILGLAAVLNRQTEDAQTAAECCGG